MTGRLSSSLNRYKFRLGEWTVSPEEGSIERRGRALLIQPKAMELLVYLAENAGDVLSKDQLFAAVWPDTLVEEGALTQCVHSLRKALGCNSKNPTYITTLPRRGYRLEAAVRPLAEPAEPPPEPDPRVEEGAQTPARTRAWILAVSAIALGLTVIAYRQHLTAERPVTLALKPLEIVATSGQQEQSRNVADGLIELVRRELTAYQGLNEQLRLRSQQTASWIRENSPSMEGLADLGIDFLLEGSLLDLAGDRLGLRVSLRRVRDDRELWQNTYDPSLLNIPSLATTISAEIIGALDLDGGQAHPSLAPSSPIPEATTAYLEGIAKLAKGYDRPRIIEAVAALENAVRLDPSYVLAWAELSKACSWLYFNGERHYQARASIALERALALGAELPEVRLATAYFYYRVEHDHRRAVLEFRRVAKDRPLDGDVLVGMGYALCRQGELHQAIELLERAFLELSPLDASLAGNIAAIHQALRAFDRADYWYQNALAIDPNLPRLRGDRALNIALSSTCSSSPHCALEQAWTVLGGPATRRHELAYFYLLLDLYALADADEATKLAGFRQALDRLDQIPTKDRDTVYEGKVFWRQAIILERSGEPEAARELAQHYRDVYLDKVAEADDYARHHAFLGIASALLGDRDTALSEGDRAVELATARGVYSSPRQKQNLALIHLLLGENRPAIALLRELLATPYQYALTRNELVLDPLWDPLRHDSEFQELLMQR